MSAKGGEFAGELGQGRLGREFGEFSPAVAPVDPPQFSANCLVVAGQPLEGSVGHTRFQHIELEDADEAVAAADAVVEKAQWQARGMAFDPQRHLAQIDGERVFVDRIEAMSDHVAQCGAVGFRRRLGLTATDDRQFAPDVARRRQ